VKVTLQFSAATSGLGTGVKIIPFIDVIHDVKRKNLAREE
jgi:hypothetical protein